jgi:hypothetical protein
MSNHTPGPWRVHAGYEIIAGDCFHIAFAKANFPEHMQTQLANAKLIAAAPELLAACEALVEAMHDYEWSVDDSPTPKHRAMMIAAIAAIKKARGD